MTLAARDSDYGGKVPGWLLVAFFVSGAAGLVYEVAWSKVLSYTFGNSLFAISTVVAAFFGGLALGAYLLGPPLARSRRRITLYVLLECGVAVLGLLSVPALRGIEPFFIAIHRSLEPSFPVFLAIRFACLFLVLLLPTALMGATLPLLVAHAEGRRFGGALSRLYAANTFGAVAGTLGAALLLVPSLGLFGSTIVAAIANVVAAAIAWTRRAEEARAPETEPAPASDAVATARAEAAAPAGSLPLLIAVGLIALSGFAALLLEVSWTRILTLVIGSSVISFALVLAFYLLGIAAGSALIARRLARVERPLALFAYLEIGLALAVLTHLYFLPQLPGLFLKIVLDPRMNLLLYLSAQALLIAALVVPPCLFLGAIFPLCARLLYHHDASRATGLTYAVNTAGTILGSLATGFLLIPLIGTRTTIIVGALLSMLVGLVALARDGARRTPLTFAVAATVAAVALIGLAPRWNQLVMTAGVFRPVVAGAVASMTDPTRSENKRLEDAFAVDSIVFFREGINTTVSLNKNVQSGELFLKIGGKTDASSGDIETQLLSGHIPMIFAADSARAMVIGQGSGMTLASVLKHGVRSAEIIEIEDAVIEASRAFHPHGQDPLDDPRTTIILEDGRTRLAVTQEKYDVIISEPSNPWLAGNNNLFTRDFYRLVRSRLAPGGVFGQWIQLYEISPTTLAALLAAFRSEFPTAYAFLTFNADLILVAAPAEATARFDRFQRPEIRNDLRRVNLDPPELILSYYMCELSELPPNLLAGKPNTDDNAFVEYRAPIDLFEVGRRDMLAGRGEQLTSQIPCSGVVPFAGGLSPRDIALWRADGLARRGRFDWAEKATGWLAEMGRTDTADSLTQVIEILKVDARSRAISLEITSLHRSGRAVEAERRLVDLLALAPNDPVVNFNLGLLLMQTGRIDAADSLFALVIENGVGSPVVRSNNNRGIIAVRRGSVDTGLAFFHTARALRADLPESYLYEAQILDEMGRLDEAIDVIARGMEALPGHTTLTQTHDKLLAKRGGARSAAAGSAAGG